jgi:hypothetical protein
MAEYKWIRTSPIEIVEIIEFKVVLLPVQWLAALFFGISKPCGWLSKY